MQFDKANVTKLHLLRIARIHIKDVRNVYFTVIKKSHLHSKKLFNLFERVIITLAKAEYSTSVQAIQDVKNFDYRHEAGTAPFMLKSRLICCSHST